MQIYDKKALCGVDYSLNRVDYFRQEGHGRMLYNIICPIGLSNTVRTRCVASLYGSGEGALHQFVQIDF